MLFNVLDVPDRVFLPCSCFYAAELFQIIPEPLQFERIPVENQVRRLRQPSAKQGHDDLMQHTKKHSCLLATHTEAHSNQYPPLKHKNDQNYVSIDRLPNSFRSFG